MKRKKKTKLILSATKTTIGTCLKRFRYYCIVVTKQLSQSCEKRNIIFHFLFWCFFLYCSANSLNTDNYDAICMMMRLCSISSNTFRTIAAIAAHTIGMENFCVYMYQTTANENLGFWVNSFIFHMLRCTAYFETSFDYRNNNLCTHTHTHTINVIFTNYIRYRARYIQYISDLSLYLLDMFRVF